MTLAGIVKRAFDLTVAAVGLLLAAPLMASIALAIKWDTPGPVLFRQERVGRGGRTFRIHKFRTMVADAEARGPALTIGNDTRITRVGQFLRRSKLDELPQLLDVLAGEMSLVGPRPELPQYVARYPAALRDKVLVLRPGITDPVSLAFAEESTLLARAPDPEREYVEVILPRKLSAAVEYAEQATLVTDLKVIARTLRMLLRRSLEASRSIGRSGGGARTVWHHLDALLALLRPYRQRLSLAVDGLTIALAWNATYLFRLGFERWISARPAYDAWVMLGIIAAYLVAFVTLRLPQSMWRFSGFNEVTRLAWASAAAGLASAAVVIGLGLREVPRSVLALHPVVVIMAVCLVRLAYRMVYEHARRRITGSDTSEVRRAIVLGAGETARLLLTGPQPRGWSVIGLLDDDCAKHGARIAGVPVLGPLSALRERSARGGATHVVIAIPSLRGAARRQLYELAVSTGLPVLTVPSAEELRSGAPVSDVRDIEPEDLLGREPVVLDEAGIDAVLRSKTVLITGAGGSIGSELCRQVARYAPARLVLYELSEFNLYSIEQDLGERFPGLPLTRLIGDVKDVEHLRAVFAKWRPEVVFHAAAYKHVPLMEEHDNAWQCLRNNVLGTYHAALAAAEQGVGRFVLISTDKAVNPTNVMGATKRAAEMVISSMAAKHSTTRFMAVRFGNVLGSSGSVIPKFKEQIARGGPVTVTHPDIIRYFMTIPEAARLVLQAAAIGESGQVLVLDMGEPVKVVELARQMIRLAGRSEAEIRIEFSGLRAGEKLFEELLADADTTLPTAVPALRVARLAEDQPLPEALVRSLLAADRPSERDVKQMLSTLVAEYEYQRGQAATA